MDILAVTPSVELYGADRMFAHAVGAVASGTTREVAVVAPEDGELTAKLRAEGRILHIFRFQVVRKSLLSFRGSWRALLLLSDLFRCSVFLLKRTRSDAVIYVNTITSPQWLVAARILRRFPVCHVREIELRGALTDRLLLAPLLACRLVVCNSEATAGWVRATWPRLSARLHVVYNGVDVDAVDQTQDRQFVGALDVGPLNLVVVGRLSPRKGQDVAVRALAELKARGCAASLTIVGGVFPGYEWYELQLRDLINHLGLSEVVTLSGFQAETAPFYAGADVLLVPSLQEPFGTVALEGMARGLPVIASDVEGLREIVVPGVTGALVPAGSPSSLAEAIEAMAVSPQWRMNASKAGAARVKARFTLDAYRGAIRGALLPALARTHVERDEVGSAASDLGAVIVHYHAPDEAHGAVRSLLEHGVSEDAVCVIDNGSRPGFAERLRASFPALIVLERPDNPGYGAAANEGLRFHAARGRKLLLVATHEIRFMKGNASNLRRTLERSGASMVGPLIAKADDPARIWSAGGKISRVRQRAFNAGRDRLVADMSCAGAFEVDWVEGCCFLADIASMEWVGGFDERFFMYMEEVDLAWRLRSRSRKVLLEPSVVISQSPGNLGRFLAVRNRTLLLGKNGTTLARGLWLLENAVAVPAGLLHPAGYRARLRERLAGLRSGREALDGSGASTSIYWPESAV
jgi:glycosyltransferase involved in cell wall biosynthesis/GT2 family glycosyltransferase